MRLFLHSVILVAFASIALAVPAGAELLANANPAQSVPDGGMTAILLGGALAVLALVRRFVKR
jgi:VPDSG-CTERM motif